MQKYGQQSKRYARTLGTECLKNQHSLTIIMVHLDVPPGKPRCPKCRSGHVDGVKEEGKVWLICMDCGWDEYEERQDKA